MATAKETNVGDISGHAVPLFRLGNDTCGDHSLIGAGSAGSFPGGSVLKNLPASAEDTEDSGSIPESERSLGGRHDSPVQESCLENTMDRGAWWGYSPWGHKESDTTEQLSISVSQSDLFSFFLSRIYSTHPHIPNPRLLALT